MGVTTWLVVSARLFGLGPYAEVLDGLPSDAGEGLLPSAAIGDRMFAALPPMLK